MTNTYKLRAECLHDATLLLELPLASLNSWCRATITRGGMFPDVEVTFESTLTLGEIKLLLRQIPDGHVMLETVALEAEYTGERKQ